MLKSMLLLLCPALALGHALPDDAKLYVELGHTYGIESVAFSPDAHFVVTTSGEGPARLWDVRTGREVRTFDSQSPKYAAFSPDGNSVLTIEFFKMLGSVHLWDVRTGAELKTFQTSRSITSVAFSHDGRWVLTGGQGESVDASVQLWDVRSGKVLKSFYGLLSTLGTAFVAISHDGRFVLAGSEKTSLLWNSATGTEVRRFERDRSWLKSVEFSPDGRYLLTPDNDAAILLDRRTGAETRRFKGHSGWVTSVAFSSDGRCVLTGGSDGTAQLWDAGTGAEIQRFKDHSSSVTAAAFSSDGRFVVTGSSDKTARLWDAGTGAEIQRFQGRLDNPLPVAFSPDGRFLLTGTDHNVAQLWDTATGTEVRSFKGHSDSVRSVAFSTDGRFILTGSDDKTARVWDSSTGVEVRRFEGHSGDVASAAFTRDGRFVLTGSDDKSARLWEMETGKEIRRFAETSPQIPRTAGTTGNRIEFTSVAISPDGRYVLTGSRDKTVRLWEAATGNEVRHFENLAYFVDSVVVSSDGRYLLTGFQEANARLWDMATGAEITEYGGTWGTFVPLAFSPDGLSVLSGSQTNAAWLHDVKTGKLIRAFEGHFGAITSAAFSPDGRFLVTSSSDRTMRLWETATGKWVATLVSFGEDWAVVDPVGRFDTSNLDGGAPLHWSVRDDPNRPLPLEIFMRDYYTPRLLTRIINGEPLPGLPNIGDIKNRVQPEVEIAKVEPTAGNPNQVDVHVHAASRVEKAQASGLQDLRLFRDGQLVGYREGALEDGSYVFRDVKLRQSAQKAVFTAYAFNRARIKSATAQREFEYRVASVPKPKAFLVQVGVNHYHAAGCDLRYAANDAHKLHDVLEARLTAREFAIQAAELVSTDAGSEVNASKNKIRLVLSDIAAEATPEDVLFLSFSGHGVARRDGQFYILPSDIQGSCASPDSGLLTNAISADELAEWLRPIDAGEMIFVLDSCYSARSVEANDFKPGPMGNRGLGQLAYDKRMRILAASQSDTQALEDSRLGQGVLSYVLTEKGLVEGKADWKPKDKQITVGEWLAYAADEVPKMNERGKPSGRSVSVDEIRKAQVPAVFDFSSKDEFVIQR